MDIHLAQEAIRKEHRAAIKAFGQFNSAHEGFAVIKEELDELWDSIKTKGTTSDDWAKEAIQVGAMALRFLGDLC